jgi:putative ABC transport system substrate-binding protein
MSAMRPLTAIRPRGLAVVLAAAICAAPGVAASQPAGKVYQVGLLAPTGSVAPLRAALRDLGYIEGQHVEIEHRGSEGRFDRLPALAAELAELPVDVIVAVGSESVQAAKSATSTIPIVMMSAGDPVASGFVVSLARPGGNITGLSNVTDELPGKQLQLLKEVMPALTRVAVLWNPPQPAHARQLRSLDPKARSLGLQIQPIEVATAEDIERAFTTLGNPRTSAVLLLGSDLHTRNFNRIARLALRSKLPTMAAGRRFAQAGGLMSYGANDRESVQGAATYVDKILKGVRPADLPVQQPTRFELLVNLKVAKVLGLTVPQSVRAQADQVIQ